MTRPPRAPAALSGSRQDDAAAWLSALRQEPQGFDEVEANRGDGMAFADNLSQGKGSIFGGMAH